MSQLEYIKDRKRRNFYKRLERRNQIVKRCLFFVTTLLVVFILSVSYLSMTTKAAEENDKVAYKYFKSVTVEYGDSLWTIADEYCDLSKYDAKQEYINEVARINHLSDGKILAGMSLIIPYYSYEFVK